LQGCTHTDFILRPQPLQQTLDTVTVDMDVQGSREAIIPSSDSFERCALHSLCTFHGATSNSIPTPSGRQVLARRPPAGTESPSSPARPPAFEVGSSIPEGTAADVQSGPGRVATAHSGSVGMQQSAQEEAFTVVEVLLVLDGSKDGQQLSERALQQHRRDHYPPEWGGCY
jgi:hypothetical protein